MSTLTDSTTGATTVARLERIRWASFGALTMLFLQFVLGAAYGLYGTAPTATKSVGLFSSPLLAIHVILGILLVIAAAMLVFRVVQARAGTGLLVTSIVSLVAIIGAGIAGGQFAQNGADGASLGMAIGTAVAMLCYTVNLVILPGKQRG